MFSDHGVAELLQTPAVELYPWSVSGMYSIAPWSRRRPGDQAAVRPKMPVAFSQASSPRWARFRFPGWLPRAARLRRIGMLRLPGRQRAVLRGIEASLLADDLPLGSQFAVFTRETRLQPMPRTERVPAWSWRLCLVLAAGGVIVAGGALALSGLASGSHLRPGSAVQPGADRWRGDGRAAAAACLPAVCRLPGAPKPRDSAAVPAAALVNRGYGATGHSGTG
jgi:hypothetical protein